MKFQTKPKTLTNNEYYNKTKGSEVATVGGAKSEEILHLFNDSIVSFIYSITHSRYILSFRNRIQNKTTGSLF